MKREDVALLLQLLQAMQEVMRKIDHYFSNGDSERLNSAKKELLELQTRVRDLL